MFSFRSTVPLPSTIKGVSSMVMFKERLEMCVPFPLCANSLTLPRDYVSNFLVRLTPTWSAQAGIGLCKDVTRERSYLLQRRSVFIMREKPQLFFSLLSSLLHLDHSSYFPWWFIKYWLM